MSEQQRLDLRIAGTSQATFTAMIAAANRHDLETLVAYFAPDYRAELPLTPERNFIGREGVSNNWSQIFALMPDFRVEILHEVVDGDSVWAELLFHGTQENGTQQIMRGVNIMGIQAGQIVWGKLYQNAVSDPSNLFNGE